MNAMIEKKKVSPLFALIKGTVRFLYGKMNLYDVENVPTEPCVFVGNHCKLNGPVCAELFFDDDCYIWCAGQMMNLKEVPSYAYNDFWSSKPVLLRPMYRMLSYLIAPLSVLVLNNARTIGVYHDMRVLSTFRASVDLLGKGAKLVIFPEKHETNNNIVYKFNDKFVDVARFYYNAHGKNISFVPMYISPELRGIYFGKSIEYKADNLKQEERERICDYLSKSITEMAVNLPCHTVVPYGNIPKKKYLKNTDITEVPE